MPSLRVCALNERSFKRLMNVMPSGKQSAIRAHFLEEHRGTGPSRAGSPDRDWAVLKASFRQNRLCRYQNAASRETMNGKMGHCEKNCHDPAMA